MLWYVVCGVGEVVVVCDDDMVHYFSSQKENGHKSNSETHRRRDKPDTGNGELARSRQLRLIRSRKNRVSLTQ